MDQQTVEVLEAEIEEAIATVMKKSNLNQHLPLKLNPHTLHMMAKAAVSVYEAVAESDRKMRDR